MSIKDDVWHHYIPFKKNHFVQIAITGIFINWQQSIGDDALIDIDFTRNLKIIWNSIADANETLIVVVFTDFNCQILLKCYNFVTHSTLYANETVAVDDGLGDDDFPSFWLYGYPLFVMLVLFNTFN